MGRVVFIGLLRAAAMPIRDLQSCFGLVARGPGNEDERVEVLERTASTSGGPSRGHHAALELIELKLALYCRTEPSGS